MKETKIGTIVKILHKNTVMMLPRMDVYRALVALVILGIVAPCIVTVGFMSYVMTEALNEVGKPVGGIHFELQLLSAFSMVFGTLVIFSVLFFSSDREHFVTLPIPAHHLMMGKFVYAFVAESLMEIFVLAAVFVGYFIAMTDLYGARAALGPVEILAALLGSVLIPLVPMIYCAMFSLILMAFLKNVRSIKVFYHLSGAMLFAFVALFLYSLKGLGQINIENYVEALGSGKDMFLKTLNVLFFPVPILTNALEKGSLLLLLLYVALNGLGLLLLYGMGWAFYGEGLYTAAALGTGKKPGIKDRDVRKNNPFFTCLLKEIRVLLRTRAFASNCVYVNSIWPIGALILFRFSGDEGSMVDFIRLYRTGHDRTELTLTLAVIAIAFLATSLNSIASSAFTREGQQLWLVKYIPAPFSMQVLAKALAATIFTYPFLLLTDVIICICVGVPLGICALYALYMLLAHGVAVVCGIWLDSISPYVEWDDEYSALRSNRNTFFNMAVMMLLAAAFVEISFLLFEVALVPVWEYYLFMAILLGLALAGTIFGVGKRILRNMESM